eukprot:CAMPEP_0185790026 /NCGR_PEP_ID=MMETSP1174-20130828/154169_1 /TAXON_ID=35687 /ORGANISM="Dictyocha speculum, Strain CCMP1381" /LENGTH=91 /DNA_ID=CAMNT_0028484479 /DNA_START=30 /DNA_END=302 /DNA_ORIENTATION=+
MSPAEIKEMASKQDMSLVSKHYELKVPDATWNLVNGQIARILLIQMQFLKKELLVAMSAIEDLMDSNNFNFRLMATVPALLVTFIFMEAVK